jgi:hypothetical protein
MSARSWSTPLLGYAAGAMRLVSIQRSPAALGSATSPNGAPGPLWRRLDLWRSGPLVGVGLCGPFGFVGLGEGGGDLLAEGRVG